MQRLDPTFNHSNSPGVNANNGYLPANYDPLNHFRIDPYLGHGGGVCAEHSAKVTFAECNFIGNSAAVGGGLFGGKAELRASDCNFVSNRAYQGGGMFGQNGSISISRSQFSNNIAPDDANDPNVLGQGGGLHFWSAPADIVDSIIAGNIAEAVGGGLYFGGDGLASLRNCLITDNSAGQTGGAVAATTFAQLKVANCTIVNNAASQGGGLSSIEGGFIDVINSIIWDNIASFDNAGSQISVTGNSPPAGMQVRYSDIQDTNIPLDSLDLVFCFDTTISMGGDIDAVKSAARDITNAIAAKFSSFRLALVDYRDYNVPDYGETGDWPYRDRVRFTTSADELILGLQPMVAGGGDDLPESAYTALMHCIDPNALVARLTADGNENFIRADSPGLGEWRGGGRVMRVILLITDDTMHDPEPFTNYELGDIVAAAGGKDRIHIIPVQIRNNPGAERTLRPLAERTQGAFVHVASSAELAGAVIDAIDLISQVPPPILVGPNNTLDMSNNIASDPCFAFEGNYFLSQIAAGQDFDSPCVNAGSGEVNSPDINLAGYTTRTDAVSDAGIVDIGYHYSAFTPSKFHLTINAGDGVTLADITPSSGDYTWFSKVQLHVSVNPGDGNQIVWTGTDDDTSDSSDNTVRMTGDKTVTVAIGKNTV